MTIVLQCTKCRHFDRAAQADGAYRCEAFPDGIPRPILMAEHDHREACPGDRGIRFEPIEAGPWEPLRPIG